MNDLLELLGLAAIVVGLWMLLPAAGVIAAGVGLILFANTRPEKKQPVKEEGDET